ncbi:hypothetical protein [Carboxylicivirga sp. RSCT41]|uniref:hypothetical protein n=1 Tax=Carboxylicivirga agarovorans TaxID=3417570 RepID=UPI003D34A636
MNLNFLKPTILLVIILISGLSNAQVSDIKRKVRSDTKSSSYSTQSRTSYNRSSDDDYLMTEIANGIASCVAWASIEAQRNVLQNENRYPNTVSLEAILDYGTNLSELTLNPTLRGNWGIYASELRYHVLHDYTGSLESLDWQVLILRVPIRNFKANYGIGFTSLFSPQTTYAESSTGFDLCLLERKLKLTANYRWTFRRNSERYRQEFKFTADYLMMQKGNFHLSPIIGVTYQNYFNEDEFWFFNCGVRLRFGR